MAGDDLECSDHKPFITVKSKDGTEHTYYSILYEDLPEEMLRKAREEVNETEENKREGMKKLKEYMKKEDLPDIDDIYIISVLRCCKYDIKKSKVKLVKFIKTYRMIMTKMEKYDIEEVGALISEMGFGIFPYRDREGRVITFCHPFVQVFSYDMELIENGFVAGIFFVLTLPMTSLLGMTLVTESTVPEMRYFYPLMRIFIHMIPYVLQLPHRFAAVKILNEHFLARLLYKIMRPFLPDKIVKRIAFLGSGYGEYHKDYPPEIMPEEFGGYLGPMNAKVYKQKMLDRLKSEIEKVKRFSPS